MSLIPGVSASISNTDTSADSTTNTNNSSISATNSNISNDTTTANNSKVTGTSETSNTGATANTSGTNQGTTQNTSTSSNTANTSTTSASAAAIAAQQNLYNTAVKNSTDTSSTDNLVSSILKNAAISFGSTQGANTPSSGIYNSTTQGLLQGNAQAQATADAAGAVLNYQTGQQQLAQSAAGGLINATSTTNSSGTSTTDQIMQSLVNSITSAFGTSSGSATGSNASNTANTGSSNTNILGNVANAAASQGLVVANSNSNSQSEGAKSIICTALMEEGTITKKIWARDTTIFWTYPKLHQIAYLHWAEPAAAFLGAHPKHPLSFLIRKTFVARTQREPWAHALIVVICTIAGLLSKKAWKHLLAEDLGLGLFTHFNKDI
jgi:hypothetical protein